MPILFTSEASDYKIEHPAPFLARILPVLNRSRKAASPSLCCITIHRTWKWCGVKVFLMNFYLLRLENS